MGSSIIKRRYVGFGLLFVCMSFFASACQVSAAKSDIQVPTVPKSRWLEAEKSLYSSVLETGQFDALVVPFQVTEHAFDSVARSLMTRVLVARIEAATDWRLPNPTVVARALGKYQRSFDHERVYDLARKLGVHTIVWGFAGHDNRGNATFSIDVQRGESGKIGPDTKRESRTWAAVKFSDSDLPYEKLQALIDSLDDLVPTKTGNGTLAKDSISDVTLHDSLSQLLQKPPESLLDQAVYLQLIGVLFPKVYDREKEQLFERSLVALTFVDPGSPGYSLLKARAYFYLHRRPAALHALGTPNNAAEKSFYAFLNGNLRDLNNHIETIELPLNELIARIELTDLQREYETKTDTEFHNTMVERYPEWALYVSRRFKETDPWALNQDIEIKIAMDRHFPIPGFSAETLIKGKEARLETLSDSDIVNALAEHKRKTLENNGSKWCCEYSTWAINSSDHFDLLVAIAEANIAKRIQLRLRPQGLPDRAMKLIEDYRAVFDGHPIFAELEYRVLTRLSEDTQGLARDNLRARAKELAFNAYFWSGGQTYIATALISGISPIRELITNQIIRSSRNEPIEDSWEKEFFVSDFPPRSLLWPLYNGQPNRRLMIRKMQTHLDYAHTDFELFTEFHAWIKSQDKKIARSDADALIAGISDRFVGHPDRATFLGKKLRVSGKFDEMRRVYQEEIDQGTANWPVYLELAQHQIISGEYGDAFNTFLHYPPFASASTEHRVRLSNRAYDAGSFFFWRGKVPEAKRLYRLSADFRTGSAAEMASNVRLALLDEDYKTAAIHSLSRVRRYPSVYAFRDYMTLLHVLGHHDQSWALFDDLLNEYGAPQMWTAAFIGHRLQAKTDDEIISWLRQPNRRSSYNRQKRPLTFSLSSRYALMSLLVDRPANDEVPELIRELIEYQPVVKKRVKDWIEYNQLYPVFAQSYNLLKQGEYAEAHELLKDRTLATFADFAFPYTAWAAVKSNRTRMVKQRLAKFKSQLSNPVYRAAVTTAFDAKKFHYFLAAALFAGGEKRHKEATTNLKQAFNLRPHTNELPIFSWYQMVEACEWLYQDSGEDVYRQLALKWARDYQVIQPFFAWAYAVEAIYSDEPDQKKKALALALFLDKRSHRLADIPEHERNEALTWLKSNNLFRQQREGVRS